MNFYDAWARGIVAGDLRPSSHDWTRPAAARTAASSVAASLIDFVVGGSSRAASLAPFDTAGPAH
jgi:hypothetical protein